MNPETTTPVVKEKSKFVNPYRDCRRLQKDAPTRLNMDILSEDYNFLRGLRFDNGTITTTFGIIFQKLVQELKRRGIHDITNKQQFEQFIINFVFALPGELPRSSVGESSEQATRPDDGGRATGTGAGNSTPANEQSELPRGANGEEGKGSSAGKRTRKR